MRLGSIAAATDLGHVVLMTDSEGVDDLEISAVHALLARGVEKFVYATMATSTRSVPQALRDRRLVLVNTVDPSLAAPAVVPDDFEAGRTAATTLVGAGHSTGIWLVGAVPTRSVPARQRLAGVKAGLRAAGLRLAGKVPCGWWPDESRGALAGLITDGWWQRGPTAVIALNDRLAMGVYQAVTASGRRVPEDLSVISFDNSDIGRWLEPGLSSLDLPYFDLGRRAVELLLADGAAPTVHRLRMRLRARASVAPPRPRTPTAPRPVRLPAADRPS